MNQQQRDYLIKQADRTYQKQRKALEEQEPTRPNLNNYLVAAVLDGSFQLQPVEAVRETIRVKVLELGPSDALIHNEDDYYGRRKKPKSDDAITLPADKLFVIPTNYLEAFAKYEAASAEWAREKEQLEEIMETVKLKLQIGSSKSLEKLIEQADNLADLNIVNTNLLLTSSADETKKLKA